MSASAKRQAAYLIAAALLLAVAFALAVKLGGGAIHVSWGELAAWATGREIAPGDPQRGAMVAAALGRIRAPRALMAMLAGAALAASGVVYQAILRNPLAEPYTLGVSGGATLGAILAIALARRLGDNAYLQNLPVLPMAALAGAGLTVLVIHLMTRATSLLSSGAIILAGVTMNMIFGSMILLIQYFSEYTQVYQMIRWMMGGLDVIGYGSFVLLGPLAAVVFATLMLMRRDLDPLSIDPLTAAAVGVSVRRSRWILLLSTSMLTGGVVAFSGPIGFVGLIVPHCVRAIAGASHARSLPLSMISGALFLLACDSLAQNALPGGVELPVGIITSMLGGPFFVYILLSRRGRGAVWLD